MEDTNDQTVNLMYGFDTDGNVKGIVINVACPAQVVEGESVVSSDFWGEVRSQLNTQYPGVVILPQCAPAGDQSPIMPGDWSNTNRWSLLTQRATAIKNAAVSQFDIAKKTRQSSVELKHIIKNISLTCKPVWGGIYPFELHAIRIGSAAFANNPCELYVDYANQVHSQVNSSQEFFNSVIRKCGRNPLCYTGSSLSRYKKI